MQKEKGIFIGTDSKRLEKGLVLLEPFQTKNKYKNFNVMVLGKSGEGKKFTAKFIK